MANESHLEILSHGVEKWNNWREENPDIVPDLSNAVLSLKRLTKVNFSGANLEEADLVNTQLDRSKFKRANLTNAKLMFAHLSGADLTDATLCNADLMMA